MRRAFAVFAIAALSAGSALAATLDREQHAFTAADQAAARGAVLQRADLGTGWTGGASKPDLSPPQTCANYDPKQSDLVLTGAAAADWKHAGLELSTTAQVLRTEAMVKLDWQRTVGDPHAISCLRTQIVKQLSKSGLKFVSFRRVAFPAIGTSSRAYLITFDVTARGRTTRLTMEDVLIAGKRTELSITSTTAEVEQAAVAAVDARLAKILIGRAKA